MTDFIAPTQRGAQSAQTWAALRRLFFVGLLACVAGLALLAIGIILFGEWGEFTTKVMGSLGVFAGFCAVLFRAALAAERGEARLVSAITSVLAFIALVAVLLSIWLLTGATSGRVLASVGILAVGAGLTAYPIRLLDAGRARALAWATILASAVGVAWWLYMVWDLNLRGPDIPWQLRLSWATLACAGPLALACAQLFHFARRVPTALAVLAHASVALTGLALLACAIWPEELFDQGNAATTGRVLAVAGVVTLALFLAQTIILRLSREKSKSITAGAPTPLVKIVCPRCEANLSIKPGEPCACASCNLQLKLEIDGHLCTGCGYPLWNLPTRKCPECGRAF